MPKVHQMLDFEFFINDREMWNPKAKCAKPFYYTTSGASCGRPCPREEGLMKVISFKMVQLSWYGRQRRNSGCLNFRRGRLADGIWLTEGLRVRNWARLSNDITESLGFGLLGKPLGVIDTCNRNIQSWAFFAFNATWNVPFSRPYGIKYSNPINFVVLSMETFAVPNIKLWSFLVCFFLF